MEHMGHTISPASKMFSAVTMALGSCGVFLAAADGFAIAEQGGLFCFVLLCSVLLCFALCVMTSDFFCGLNCEIWLVALLICM